jgi:toxin ParE1/3/4
MKVVVSPAAEADLAEIFQHTLENWGSDQASEYIDLLVARFKWLTTNRSLWRSRDDLRPGLCGQYEGRHLIVYREVERDVQVVRVLHQRMDPAGHDLS